MERAAQKLRLDQLVIQQGRMTQQQKGASKEELLTMIQHGAENIFKDTDSYVLFYAIACITLVLDVSHFLIYTVALSRTMTLMKFSESVKRRRQN